MTAIAPLFKGAALSGLAKTARIPPGQNAAIHRAVHTAKAGQVLVVDGGASRSFGPFGDILASCCQNQGVVGLVIDSTVRDASEIEELGFPVFCLGTNPSATQKDDVGAIDVEISCGGVRVCPDDVIVGDADGVVVIPRDIATEVAERAKAVVQKESDIKKRLAAGETTYEIFGL